MRTRLAFPIVVCLLSVSALAWTAAQQSTSAGLPQPSAEDLLKSVREDLQNLRAEIMAKNMTLSADQAAKFWPVFNAYQKEQNVIMDSHMNEIRTFVKNIENMDDSTALALIKAHFDRDTKMNALRQKWLPEFQKVLPTKLAVRAMQIDRRLSLVTQLQLTSQIPLAQ